MVCIEPMMGDRRKNTGRTIWLSSWRWRACEDKAWCSRWWQCAVHGLSMDAMLHFSSLLLDIGMKLVR